MSRNSNTPYLHKILQNLFEGLAIDYLILMHIGECKILVFFQVQNFRIFTLCIFPKKTIKVAYVFDSKVLQELAMFV